jgi:hypothetical protein
MIEQDFILLILNCEKYRYKAEKQKETWLKELDNYNNNSNNIKNSILYFHIIGNPELEKDYLFDFSNSILYLKVNDDYNSLPKKVLNAYKAINIEYKFKYIFKTDDDQKLFDIKFLINLQKILFINIKNEYNNENKRIHYGGHIVNIDKPYLSQYSKLHPELPDFLPLLSTQYCSGRFYFLSNIAIKYLLKKEEDIAKEYLEDYAIGYNLHELFKQNILSLQTNKYFIDY